VFESFFKSNLFGPVTMHGGANALNPAMHGGGVQVPRDGWRGMPPGCTPPW
jgi:hypothetical protein